MSTTPMLANEYRCHQTTAGWFHIVTARAIGAAEVVIDYNGRSERGGRPACMMLAAVSAY